MARISGSLKTCAGVKADWSGPENSMRIIAGSAKGRLLRPVPGDSTRPITDRVKSALFSILESRDMIKGRRFLDLFGGTGAVGIEALSRGAAEAMFCERDRRALQTLKDNLIAAGLQARGVVVAGDAFESLKRESVGAFDVIYVAPPQYQGIWLNALLAIDARPSLLSDEGLVIVQIFPKEWTEPSLQNLCGVDSRHYGSTALHFFARRSREPDGGALSNPVH
jgi:16S rRNA (guanine(966)-N(2))-methyltransferase RsmD